MRDEILGYVSALSVAPGQTLTAMVSTSASRFNARIVRLVDWQTDRDLPDTRGWPVFESLAGAYQAIELGSFGVGQFPQIIGCSEVSIMFTFKPSAEPGTGRQGVFAIGDPDKQAGLSLVRSEDERLQLRLWNDEGATFVEAPHAGIERWSRIVLGFAPDRTTLTIEDFAVKKPIHSATGAPVGAFSALQDAVIVLGAAAVEPIEAPKRPWRALATLSGRLADLTVTTQHRTWEELESLFIAPDEMARNPTILLSLDAGRSVSSTRLVDLSRHKSDVTLFNGVYCGVTNHNWDGRFQSRKDCSRHYSALQFHPEAVDDANWSKSLDLTVPKCAESGLYGLELKGADGDFDVVPFVVTPPANAPSARILMVMPTLTYLAYAGELLTADKTPRFGRQSPFDPRSAGLGLYDRFANGDGVRYSTSARPLHNMRVGFLNVDRVGLYRNFAADVMILEWLAREGFAVDIVTDNDLHCGGSAALERYAAVITGCHPEYATYEMMRAYRSYLTKGGRLLYLGGNGFYWKTVIDPSRPDVIEVSRGFTGTRLWESAPGEAMHLTTGELGGLWRHLGISPHDLVGNGFSGMGVKGGGHYQLNDVPDDLAWLIEGVPESFGKAGLTLGRAASDEVDSVNHALGTPTTATIIASAELPEDYVSTPEDFLEMPRTLPGVMSDVVFRPYPSGGFAFAAGSIGWPGAMLVDDGVSRMTRNVIERCLDDPICFDEKATVVKSTSCFESPTSSNSKI